MRYCAILAILIPCFGAASGTDKRPINQKDILDFHWAIGPQISPDGSKIVYTYVTTNSKQDGYATSLWIVPTSGTSPARQLTAGPRDSSAQWSPDGKTLAFVRSETATEGRRPSGQIYLLPLEGGEARPLTDLPRGAASPVWSPDGKSIAFSSTTTAKDSAKAEEPPSDVRVILKATYRSNGGGYTQSERASHIWIVDVPAAPGQPQKARALTSGPFTETDTTWSKDGAKIYYTSNRELEPYYKAQDSDVYSIATSGGEPVKIASIDGPIRGLSLSPDGLRLAFVGTLTGKPIRSYSQPDLWVMPLNGSSSEPRNLTVDYDFDIGGGVGGDQHAPAGGQAGGKPFWTPDGAALIVGASEEGKTNLVRVDAASGKVTPFTKGTHDLLTYTASADASKVAAVISTPTNIGDVFSFDGAFHQLTRINEALFSQIKITEPEMIWTTSFDGKKIQSWVQRPPDYDPSKKYPLILNIHGGPHAAYGYTFDHEFQWMAAKGYIVLYPNPRGSTSYGQDFANIIQYHYPGDDYKDLMAAVDDVVARGWVDPKKMGVTGGSGGGVLTNWVIGHTDRFAAAVSQRSIANWSDFWYTADFTLFQATWFKAAPWEDEADFKARSPITYIDKIKTPTMLIEGEADFRTPPAAGGEQMFRALKYRHIPTAMVQFPGESHELSRSGKPKHRIERLEHIVAWFDKYVMGMPITTYDVQ